jgi:TPR repeat protein
MKFTIKHAIAAILLLASFAVPVLAGPFEDGIDAYGKGDYATALLLLRPLADQGTARAQIILGVMYSRGQGVAQNYDEAMKWYRRAADQGDAAAQTALGAMYANGVGVPQDHAKAMEWFRKAADQGFADAQNDLGSIYDRGSGVP